jgi:hypothetical protein
MPPEDSYITNEILDQWARANPSITKEQMMDILKTPGYSAGPPKYGVPRTVNSPPNVTSKTFNQDYYSLESSKRLEVLERHLTEVRASLVDAIQLASARDLQYQQQMTSLEKVIVALATQNKELSKRVTDLEWEGITP